MPWRHSIAALQRRHRSTGGAEAPAECLLISLQRETAPDRAARYATGAQMGRPGNVVLEKPDKEQDDDDERDESATDVHSGLLYAVDVRTTGLPDGRLRENRLATMPAATAPWPSG